MRAVIVEDEEHSRNNLKIILSTYFPEIKVVDEADSEESGIKAINRCIPDLVFMDINLSNGSGFNVLEGVDNLNFKVIFVTAYDQYAIRAFDYSAIGYVVKPIDLEELRSAISRGKLKPETDNGGIIKTFLENYSKQEKDRKISIPERDGITFVNVNEIVRCQSDSNYTEVHLKSGSKIVVSKPLKNYVDLLPEDVFFRIHQSHLVNLNEVARYLNEEGGYLVMNDGTQLEIARRRKAELLLRLYAG